MDAARINDLISRARDTVARWNAEPDSAFTLADGGIDTKALIRTLADLQFIAAGEPVFFDTTDGPRPLNMDLRGRLRTLPQPEDPIIDLVVAIKELTRVLARQGDTS